MKNIITFLLLLSASILSVNAQEVKTIKGIVENTNGTPISEAVISVKETNQTVNTDSKGRFEIHINRKNNINIVCSSSGFKRIEKRIDLNKDDIQNLLFTMQENTTALDEVIITASKKETKLQKTPTAVSAISAKEIEQRKITDMSDLVMAVPNLVTMATGAPTLNTIGIRGIVITSSNDPVIGVYIDGIPVFDAFAASMQLQDIERIEVLRGPQSTLYGRNALGGTINIFTKQPGNKLKAFAEAGIGKFNAQEYRVGISSPLIKNKLFASVNAFYTSRKGIYTNEYTHKKYDNLKNYGGNFYLKYLANDRLSFVLNSKLEKNDILGTMPYAANAAAALSKPYIINLNERNLENRTLSTTSFLAKYQFDKWELTSLTGFNYLNDINLDYDLDRSPADAMILEIPSRPHRTWTEEVKITSQNLGRWDITGGLFGLNDNQKSKTDTEYGLVTLFGKPNVPYTTSSIAEQNGKGFAAYAHVTYAISAKWKLIGGLRYDYDEKKLVLHDEYEKSPDPVEIKPSRSVGTHYSAVSYKVNLAYLPTEDITVYANTATGFRPGGVNQYASATSNYLTFKPEYTDNYEVGIKTEWLEHRLRANFAAFYTYWKDQQQTVRMPDSRVLNVGRMYSRGLELEISAIPVKNLEISYNLGTLDTRYDKLLLLDASGNYSDYKGNKQVLSPNFSSSLTVTYSGKITKDVGFFIVPEWKYLGKQYMTYYNDLVQKPFSLLNASAGISYKKLELKFWAKNITNSRYISFVYADRMASRTPTLLGLPTTFGMSLKVNL